MRKSLSAFLKYTAYVGALFLLAYATPRALDVSQALPPLSHLPGVKSLLPIVVGGGASDSERQRRPNRPSGDAAEAPVLVAVMTPVDGSRLGERHSTPRPAPPTLPRAVRSSGYVAGGTLRVTVPDLPGSGSTLLERQLAALTVGDCTDFGLWKQVDPVNTVPDGACARYRTVVPDEFGGVAVSEADTVVRRDDSAPAEPTVAISESSGNAHALGTTLFYRNTAGEAGTFTVSAVGADPQSGIAEVTLPALGDTRATSEPDPRATARYAWRGDESSEPITKGVVATVNGAGSQSETPLSIVGDDEPPAGGFISYAGGLHPDGTVEISVEAGSDAVSGVDDDSAVIEEQDAPLVDGYCGGEWSPWHSAAPDGSPGQAACVRFRYRVADNVGNERTYESEVVAQVADDVAPSVALVAPIDGAAVSGTISLVAAAEDIGFGVESVQFELSSGRHCHTEWQTIATTSTAPYGASWDTESLAPGVYRLRAVATDRAGNSAASATVMVEIPEPVEPTPAPDGDDDADDEGQDDDDDDGAAVDPPATVEETESDSPPAAEAGTPPSDDEQQAVEPPTDDAQAGSAEDPPAADEASPDSGTPAGPDAASAPPG
jgi:Big-like domain-containing protein